MPNCPCGSCPRCPCFDRYGCQPYREWEAAHQARKAQETKRRAVEWGYMEHQAGLSKWIRRRYGK